MLAALAAGLLVWFLGLFLLRGFRFPVGPDAPVYLWWTRLAGTEGLSAVERPGAVALLSTLGATGVGLPAVVAGVECALGVAIGLGAAALARAGGTSRAGWALAGALAGTFATHMVAGYVSNLVFASLLLGALVVLAQPSRPSTAAAALLLGAGGLAHPLFFFVGVAILALAGAMAFGEDRGQTRRALAAAAAGGAILGAGQLLMLVGPPVLHVDTSQDAFLRRAGLSDALAHAYVDRLIHRWTRYVQWASVPLALLGATAPRGWVRRALWAWLSITVLGVIAGVATRWFPPDRFITFGFAIPILAAAGVVRLHARLAPRRWVALAAATGLSVAMLAGAGIAWLREKPYITQQAVDDVATASAYASRTPPGTPWLFTVDSGATRISFLATQLQNVIRAAVPPDRIRDVFMLLPPVPPNAPRDDAREWAAMARLYARDAAAAGDRRGDIVIHVDRFDRGAVCRSPACGTPGGLAVVADGVSVSARVAEGPPRPIDHGLDSSTLRIALAVPIVLAALALVGLGWSSLFLDDHVSAAALSPAFGGAALVLGGFVADRVGVRLSGVGPGLLVLLIAAGAGYAALIGQRRRRAKAAP